MGGHRGTTVTEPQPAAHVPPARRRQPITTARRPAKDKGKGQCVRKPGQRDVALPTGGRYAGTATSRSGGSSATTSACSIRPGTTMGLRRPQQRRLPDQVLLDTDRSAPDGQGRSITLRSRPGRILEKTGAARIRHRWADSPCGCRKPSRPAARSVGTTFYQHRPPKGSSGWKPPVKRSQNTRSP